LEDSPLATTEAVRALGSLDDGVLHAACKVLEKMHSEDTNTVVALERVVVGGDLLAASWAAEAIRVCSNKTATAAPAMVRLILADPNSGKSLLAAKVLDGIGKETEPVAEQLADAFVATEGPTRFWISETLTSIGPGILPVLIRRVEPFLKNDVSPGKPDRYPDYRFNLLVDTIKTARNFGSDAKTVAPFVLEAVEVLRREGGRIRSEYAEESVAAMGLR
jgi:hypothetical protein